MDDSLRKYINDSRNNGFNDEKIKAALAGAGYAQAQIDEAFPSLAPKITAPPPAPSPAPIANQMPSPAILISAAPTISPKPVTPVTSAPISIADIKPEAKSPEITVPVSTPGPAETTPKPAVSNPATTQRPEEKELKEIAEKEEPKKSHGLLITICVIIIIAVLGVGGYYGYQIWKNSASNATPTTSNLNIPLTLATFSDTVSGVSFSYNSGLTNEDITASSSNVATLANNDTVLFMTAAEKTQIDSSIASATAAGTALDTLTTPLSAEFGVTYVSGSKAQDLALEGTKMVCSSTDVTLDTTATADPTAITSVTIGGKTAYAVPRAGTACQFPGYRVYFDTASGAVIFSFNGHSTQDTLNNNQQIVLNSIKAL